MARAYSQDLRDRVIDAALGGMPARRRLTSCTSLSGSTLPSFFRSTMLFCAASRARRR